MKDLISPHGPHSRDPEIMGGTPVFRGTRVPVQTLLDYLEIGDSIDESLEGLPFRHARSGHRLSGQCGTSAMTIPQEAQRRMDGGPGVSRRFALVLVSLHKAPNAG